MFHSLVEEFYWMGGFIIVSVIVIEVLKGGFTLQWLELQGAPWVNAQNVMNYVQAHLMNVIAAMKHGSIIKLP